ncbi:MAG: TonB-dependent receptor [Bacteroidetes bacterium]|nr:TonB-dependent receptor [Bacteroidota bacterium]
MKYTFQILCLSLVGQMLGQTSVQKKDSTVVLNTVIVAPKQQSPERMPEVKNNTLFSGKKNEVIKLENINGNFATNNAREIFSRVPGVTVWENEGSGIQVNVGVRGLSPNRSWEFNTRQNGYDISSDVFGYPEAYYNPPMEAVESIQIVRGGASLQFGPQFGGMLNYILKRENNKKFSFETQNTVGSYDMLSSYNALGGTYKKWSYYVYNDVRSGNGWRKNNRYNVRNTHAFVAYRFTEKTKLSAEYTNMDYKMQQPGGLTDAQFEDNPRQSFRERNWFGTPWNVFALQLDSEIYEHLSWNTKLFGMVSQRNSVGFTGAANTLDAINPTTNSYANRRVDRDFYENFGLETRSIYKFNLGNIKNNLAFGVRVYQAKTKRQQEGKGSTGSGFDLSIEGDFARDLDFKTQNLALFAENQFKLLDKFSITPGLRYENIQSEASGQFGVSAGNPVMLNKTTLKRSQPLLGLGLEYKLRTTNFYANISQAYRPVLFSDLTPPAVTDVIDPDLKDADGFNADLGYRGTYKNILNFDFGLFYLSYNNRIGGVRQFVNNDPTQGTYLYRTNLGETVSKGIESFVNLNITELFGVKNAYGNVDAFASMSFIDARYTDFKTYNSSGSAPNITIQQSNLSGNRVENAPRYIHSFGMSWSTNQFSSTLQYRMSGEIFTDANNTSTPSANGTTGLLDGYQLLDLSAEYKFMSSYNIKAGINNLTNESYATRRSGGYPGPGILPGDARTFYISLGMKL